MKLFKWINGGLNQHTARQKSERQRDWDIKSAFLKKCRKKYILLISIKKGQFLHPTTLYLDLLIKEHPIKLLK